MGDVLNQPFDADSVTGWQEDRLIHSETDYILNI